MNRHRTELILTPWARAAIPEADRPALLARIPDGNTLSIGKGGDRWTVRLQNPAGRLQEAHMRDLPAAIEAVVGMSYLRCATCGKKLTDWGDCDSCTADRAEEMRAARDDD